MEEMLEADYAKLWATLWKLSVAQDLYESLCRVPTTADPQDAAAQCSRRREAMENLYMARETSETTKAQFKDKLVATIRATMNFRAQHHEDSKALETTRGQLALLQAECAEIKKKEATVERRHADELKGVQDACKTMVARMICEHAAVVQDLQEKLKRKRTNEESTQEEALTVGGVRTDGADLSEPENPGSNASPPAKRQRTRNRTTAPQRQRIYAVNGDHVHREKTLVAHINRVLNAPPVEHYSAALVAWAAETAEALRVAKTVMNAKQLGVFLHKELGRYYSEHYKHRNKKAGSTADESAVVVVATKDSPRTERRGGDQKSALVRLVHAVRRYETLNGTKSAGVNQWIETYNLDLARVLAEQSKLARKKWALKKKAEFEECVAEHRHEWASRE